MYLTVSCHVSFHAAIGSKHHVTEATDVLLHTSMSSDVSLQYTTRHKRLQTLDAKVWFLTWHTFDTQVSTLTWHTRLMHRYTHLRYTSTKCSVHKCSLALAAVNLRLIEMSQNGSLRCFDAVGWATGRIWRPEKTCCSNPKSHSLWDPA